MKGPDSILMVFKPSVLPDYMVQIAEQLAPEPVPLTDFSLALAPFKTASLSSHQINELGNYSEMQSEIQNPKRPLNALPPA